jgi:hypothetical protein
VARTGDFESSELVRPAELARKPTEFSRVAGWSKTVRTAWQIARSRPHIGFSPVSRAPTLR